MLERIGVRDIKAVVNESLTVWPRRARVDSSASGVHAPTNKGFCDERFDDAGFENLFVFAIASCNPFR